MCAFTTAPLCLRTPMTLMPMNADFLLLQKMKKLKKLKTCLCLLIYYSYNSTTLSTNNGKMTTHQPALIRQKQANWRKNARQDSPTKYFWSTKPLQLSLDPRLWVFFIFPFLLLCFSNEDFMIRFSNLARFDQEQIHQKEPSSQVQLSVSLDFDPVSESSQRSHKKSHSRLCFCFTSQQQHWMVSETWSCTWKWWQKAEKWG